MQQLPYYPFPEGGGVRPKIPACFQLKNGNYYCFNDKGELVYIGNSPSSPSLVNLNQYPSLYASQINNPLGGLRINLQYGDICVNNFAKLVNYYGIVGRPFFGSLVYSGAVSVPVGTNNTYGSAQTVYNNNVDCPCNCGYVITLPVYLTVTWGGTFASGETVNVNLTFNISQPGTSSVAFTASKVLSATATGSQSLNINDIIAVIASAITTANTSYTIGSVTAAAASNESSTSVTVSVSVWYLAS